MLIVVVWLVLLPSGALGCGPGRLGARRRVPRKLTPLVFKQHVPNVPENSLAASGPAGERIRRGDARFGELVPNYNRDIVFKDRSSNGADRLATQRLKEVLDTLAISVMNQWPGVRLRVTEGWAEEGFHVTHSLHMRGRAADLTTSDRDPAKCGQLARLAVEAGCDWVYYEARSHIHCSVKREHTSHTKSYGCFHGDATVLTRQGSPKRVSDLRPGDVIASGFLPDQSIYFSPVVGFLHTDPGRRTRFVRITAGSGARIILTPDHLIFREGDGFVRADQVGARDVILTTVGGDADGSSDLLVNIGSGYNEIEPVGPTGSMDPMVKFGSVWEVIKIFLTVGSSDQGVEPIVTAGSSEKIYEIVGTATSSDRMVRPFLFAGSSDEVGENVWTTGPKDQVVKSGSEDYAVKPVLIARTSDRVVKSGSSDAVVETVGTSEYSDRLINAVETAGSSELVEKLVVTTGSSEKITKRVLTDGSSERVIASGSDDDVVKPVLTVRSPIRVVKTFVTSVEIVTLTGVYAPVTADGTIFVDGVWASCYALVSSHQMAHVAMFPVRWTHVIRGVLGGLRKVFSGFQTEVKLGQIDVEERGEYMHWYAKVLFWIYRLLYDE